MQEKVNVLVRLHVAMQEKLKTAFYSEPIQVLTLVPDKWSRMYCSEYFNILEYLVWTSHEIKKVGEILSKHAPEKRKSYHHWNTLSSSNKRFWRCQFQQVDAWKRKTLLICVKEYINKNWTCKSLCNLQEFDTAFKEKHPNVNIGFSKFYD